MKTPSHTWPWRTLSLVTILVLVMLGVVFGEPWGTWCSWGGKSLLYLCPLGALEVVVATGSINGRMIIGVGVSLVMMIVVGRAFCSWICPTALWKRLFSRERIERIKPKRVIPIIARQENQTLSKTQPHAIPWSVGILAVTVVGSFLTGFPLFCLVCPLGITLGVIMGIVALTLGAGSLLTVGIFLAILFVEVVLLRQWCHQLCPLGLIMTWGAKLNRFWRPSVNPNRCLRSRELSCRRCESVCPEHLPIARGLNSSEAAVCTKCGACARACPEEAIHFYWLANLSMSSATPSPVPTENAHSRYASFNTAKASSEMSVIKQARDCILCGACEEVCPQHQPITRWMQYLQRGNVRAASKDFVDNPFSGILCEAVCPSYRLCEGACQHSPSPIAIRQVEGILAREALRRGGLWDRHYDVGKQRRRAAIIGAGPTSLSAAWVLRNANVDVEVFERESQVGGILRYGLPRWKTSSALLDVMFNRLQNLETNHRGRVVFHFNQTMVATRVHKLVTDFDAVLIATGAQTPKALSAIPFDSHDVIPALRYLREVHSLDASSHSALRVAGQTIAVIGAGETAFETIQGALLEGVQKIVWIHRGIAPRVALTTHQREILSDSRIEKHFDSEIKSAQKTSNQWLLELTTGTRSLVDRVIVATGFEHPLWENWDLKGKTGERDKTDDTTALEELSVKEWVTSYRLGRATVYIAGDARRGASLVATAVKEGQEAAKAILQNFSGKIIRS